MPVQRNWGPAIQYIRRKSDHRAAVARRRFDTIACLEFQIAAAIPLRIGELHRKRKLAPRPQRALVDMPAIMAAFAGVIDGVLRFSEKPLRSN